MIVCHCERVSEAVIEAVIATGSSTVEEVTGRCRAGGGCGSCHAAIEELLESLPAAADLAQPAA